MSRAFGCACACLLIIEELSARAVDYRPNIYFSSPSDQDDFLPLNSFALSQSGVQYNLPIDIDIQIGM